MISWLWVPATILAAAAQTARNAMQKSLTDVLGTIGATQVRFLYGLPFALIFLALLSLFAGPLPVPAGLRFWLFAAAGAVSQITATALMLSAMRERSFTTSVALTKTEPVQAAVFGLAVLGDPLTLPAAAAILIATFGVLLTAWKPGGGAVALRPVALGLLSGAFFALAAVGFRGAILSLGDAHFFLRASVTLASGLAIQSALLLIWMAGFDRGALLKSLAVWRQSLFAGFTGAFASLFWFTAFALTTAANVRTLALVEVLFAHAVSKKLFSQSLSALEKAGMALIIAGVALLLLTH